MIRRLILAALILATLAMVGFSAPTLAQSVVVASCPAATPIYAVGQQNRQPAMDVNGNLCQGGGGTGASTIADGADVTQGAIADAAATAGGVGSVSAKLREATALLNTINTTLGTPMQAAGAIGASENHIGEVGSNMLPITNAMTTTNASTQSGQSIGGLQTLANAVRVSAVLGSSGTSGYVQDVTVSFTDAVATSQIEVWFFNANPSGSTCTNDAAFVLANADRDKVIGVANITDFKAGNTAVFTQAHNLAMGYGIASATSLFACVVARGSFAITGTANASLVTKVVRN